MNTIKISINILISETNPKKGILSIDGNDIAFSELGTSNFKLEAVNMSNKELTKKVTGVDETWYGGIFDNGKINTMSYRNYQRSNFRTLSFRSLENAKTVEQLILAIQERIEVVKEWTAFIDWFKKVETFTFAGKEILIKRVVGVNETPIRIFINGVRTKLTPFELFKLLINEHFGEKSKYISFSSYFNSLKVFIEHNDFKAAKDFELYKGAIEVGEFKKLIDNVIADSSTYLTEKLNEIEKPANNSFVVQSLTKTIVDHEKTIEELITKNQLLQLELNNKINIIKEVSKQLASILVG